MARERWPVPSGGIYETTCVSSGSAHTKGSWAQVTPATSFAALLESAVCLQAGLRLYLFDVGVGAAAAETVVLGNLMFQVGSSYLTTLSMTLIAAVGLNIAETSRLAIRCSSSVGSQSFLASVNMATREPGIPKFSASETYGTTLGTTRGTSIDSGGSANTKGAYAQLTAASALAAHRWLLMLGAQGNNAPAGYSWMFDLATGAAAAEQVVVPDVAAYGTTQLVVPHPSYFTFEVSIPSGTRVSCRSQATGTDATDRLMDVALVALQGDTTMPGMVVASGTFTTSGTTEGSITTIASTPGVYVLKVDVQAVAAGVTPDIFILRSKQNALAGGTERLVEEIQIVGGTEFELVKRLLIEVTDDATWTVQRAQGSSDRAFPWTLMKLDAETIVGIKKNTALAAFEFLMRLSSDHVTPATGKTITAERSIDGGAFAACANSATEVSAGVYKIDLAATDLNGNVVTFKFTEGTCDPTYVTIRTQTLG